MRPADANETAIAWKTIIEKRKPTGLVLSRQNLPVYDADPGVAKGGYIRVEASNGEPRFCSWQRDPRFNSRSAQRNNLSPRAFRHALFPCRASNGSRNKTMRTGSRSSRRESRLGLGGSRTRDSVVSTDRRCRSRSKPEHYGESADGALLMKKFGFTVDHVVAAAKESLQAAE